MLVPAVRAIGAWQELDDVPAALWLRQICGDEVYRVVWEPLLRGKFGKHAETISAAWFWSKLRLRGGSRGRRGQEQLVYFKGGFAALAEKMVSRIKTAGGRVIVGSRVERLAASNGRITCAVTEDASYAADAAIITTPLPVAASLLSGLVPDRYVADIGRISYLVNRCLVFELDRSLSELYWINVNDPSFPFVGVVEHTNLIDAADYAKRHIIYLSRYCPPDDAFLSLSTQDAVAFAVPHLQRMFPKFDPNMILKTHSWQAERAQPLVVAGYGKLIPGYETPLAGVYLATMAQVYPEDRGTNYAIRDGRKVAGLLAQSLA